METNNLYNFGGHTSESANSGLKLSSGDTLYTNGSSMSFPQTGKNMNGDMNVNGMTPVMGSSTSGPHTSTVFSHVSNHHSQSSLGYDCLWGQAPYTPAGMSAGHGPGVHPKQGAGGVMQQQQQTTAAAAAAAPPPPQQQQQQHFQGHGQYQLNGSPAALRPPTVTMPGGTYWDRSSPMSHQSSSPMSVNYSGGTTYSSYPSQVHPSMAPSQQQQRVQQQQPFGMVHNGMPYYQHQAPHGSPGTDQAQVQASVIPPSVQSFTPPRGSPLPVSLPIMPPSAAVPENGVSQTRDASLSGQGVSSALVQGCLDKGYSAVEQALGAPPLPEPQVLAGQPPAPPMSPVKSYCSPADRAAPDPGPPVNKRQDASARTEVPGPPAVSAASVLPAEAAAQNPDQGGFSDKTSPVSGPVAEAEAAASHPKFGRSDVTRRDTRMSFHSEARLEKSLKSCPAVSSGLRAAVTRATDRTSLNVDLAVKESGAGGWADASSDGTHEAKESGNRLPRKESSRVAATRAADGITLDDGSNETLAETLGTDRRSVGVSSRHGDVSQEDETMDTSSALDDSCEDASKNGASQLTDSLNDSLQSTTADHLSDSLQSTTADHLFTDSLSDDSKTGAELDVPDSVRGGAVFAPGHEQLGAAMSRAGDQLASDLVSSLSPSVTSTVACDAGKLIGRVPTVYNPQVSKLSRPRVERKRKEKTEKKGRAKVKVLGHDPGVGVHAVEERPAGFKQLTGSDPHSPLTLKLPRPLSAKPKKEKIKKLVAKLPKAPKVLETAENGDDDDEDDEGTVANGGVQRRRIATEEQVNFPLLNGWRREVRVRKSENRLKGETWYYSPCGKRMKQFPEVIKYLKRHQDLVVTREHFSFSPRMPVGDFYEERDTAEGMKWFLLTDVEVPSMIMAITGRRGRPPNPDKERPRCRARRTQGGSPRRPGRPPKPKMVDLLSKAEAKLLKRLEAQEMLTEEDKGKLNKIRRKMKRKARIRRQEEAKLKKNRQEKRRAKLEKAKEAKEREELGEDPLSHQPVQELKKPGRRKRAKAEEKVDEKVRDKVEDKESTGRGKRVSEARSKAKAEAQAEAQAQAAAAARRQAERRAQAQRRLEERKRQQMILEELKKPTEDMCLTDHKALPELKHIPGVVLSGQAFSHCLRVVEFLHSYGKVLGLQVPKDVPKLSSLQEGLLGLGDSQHNLLELLVKLVQAALCDPGLPSYYQSVKILGEKLVDLELNRSSVSEVLRVFLESHAFQADVCKSLRTKPYHALAPDIKASILAFIVDELNGSNIVIREIDNTLENMATYRKNKWTIEGKLRKLKAALARRTGRSEDELGLEERRRSARVAEDESQYLEEGMFLERSSRRARKEEVQLSEGESPATASIPELERQIDKLTKRQVFFRKKLLQASHSLRAVSLGQDRYRRRYWVMPHVGGILVEGAEEILDSGDVLVTDEPEPVAPLVKEEPKEEPKAEPPLSPPADPTSSCQLSSPEADPLPGTASLMSSPRGRGRPRKIKPEVELHLRAAKNRRRRRRSSKAGSEESAEASGPERGMQDLTQSAFLSWLSQTQGCLPPGAADSQSGDGGQRDSVKELAERHGQWFNLLPKTPCDSSSMAQTPVPASPPKDPLQAPGLPTVPAVLPPQPGLLLSGLALSLCPQVCSTPLPKPSRRRRRASSSGGCYSYCAGTKRRGRPPSKVLQEIEQKYFMQLIARPIPAAKVRGWWWIREPEEVKAVLHALHPRGVREKVLHKHLSKHMEFLTEVCSRPSSDPVFQQPCDSDGKQPQAVLQPWSEREKVMETDLSVLQWVEDLEQRVLAADLQIKMAPQSRPNDTDDSAETAAPGFQGFTAPEPDSTREDLQYHEHDVELLDDWIVRTKRECSDLLRLPTHPLDLAVVRLLRLERNIERRYLKEPLWALGEVVRLAPLTPPPGGENHIDAESLESEITPRVRAWRQAVDRCRSAAQLSLCLLQLERAIAWERSIVKVTCLVCRKGDDDEYLLLCDGCERGCHMYCLRPKVTQVPDGDWFCPICLSKENGDSPRLRRFPKPKSRSRKRHFGGYSSESSDEDDACRRRAGGMATRRRDGPSTPVATPLTSPYTRFSGESGGSSSSPSKRRRMATRNQPDLTYCEIILMEMEAHTDAWPFLEPVNPRLVPGYRRIIKNPMDFLTMRERLLQGGYLSCEDFAADAQLVFNNCQLFNEDTSEVGKAGHSMRRFFESRWAEFYKNKDK